MATGKGARLTMKMDDAELRKHIKEILRKGGDVRPVFKKLGAWMAYRSVDKTFEKQGRPKWDKLSDYTIAIRRWKADPDSKFKGKRPAFTRKILEVSGDLRGSFTFTARPKRLDVGTNYINADKHQFGYWAKAPKRWERPMCKIPKRQLIGIHPEDEDKAVEFALWHLKTLVPGAQ